MKSMQYEAIILAGGFGTRLSHIVQDVPKPMAPVCGKPFLQYVIDDLIEKSVSRIILAVGYKQQIIRDFFGARYRDCEIVYSSEDTPLYTGGAIKKALLIAASDYPFIINGDTFFDVDLAEMDRYARSVNADLVIASKEMCDFSRYGTICSDEGRIISFEEKRQQAIGDINGGIYLMRRDLLEGNKQEKFSFETDFMEQSFTKHRFFLFKSDGYFIDIGIPEDYEKAQSDFQVREK